jgi:hypothetical protein
MVPTSAGARVRGRQGEKTSLSKKVAQRLRASASPSEAASLEAVATSVDLGAPPTRPTRPKPTAPAKPTRSIPSERIQLRGGYDSAGQTELAKMGGLLFVVSAFMLAAASGLRKQRSRTHRPSRS